MTYFIGFFLLCFKNLLYVVYSYALQESLYNISIIYLQLLFCIFLIKYVMNMSNKDSIDFRIIKYCFEYNLERYYSLFIVFLMLTSITFLVIYSRVSNIYKNIDLISFKTLVTDIYLKYSFIIVILNILLFVLILYIILLFFKILRIFLNKELVKLHIYYLDKPLYKKYHNKFKTKYCIESLLSSHIENVILSIVSYFKLGYFKYYSNFTFSELSIFLKTNDTKFDVILKYLHNIYITKILYILHYILLFIFIFYDIKYNNYVIYYTFKYLPFMFFYQVYVNISKFVYDKPCSGNVCEEANMFFYHKIIYLSNKAMLVDGELYEIPTNFTEDFLRYEASGYTKDQ